MIYNYIFLDDLIANYINKLNYSKRLLYVPRRNIGGQAETERRNKYEET